MKVTFLGTGTSQGVPVIGCSCRVCTSLDYRDKRLRTSVHIEINGLSLVIDTGPDFREQMLRENIAHLDAVLMTHAHRDHTAGLDEIRAFNFIQDEDIPLYGKTEVLNQLKHDFSYIFSEHPYPGIPKIQMNAIGTDDFVVKGVNITPLPVMHLKLPVTGFRIGDFSYITDANFISEETFKKLEGTSILALNALQKEKHISHFTLSEAIAIAQKVGASKTYLIHLSHKMGMHSEVEGELPPNVMLATDGLQINL